ncbi:MAG: hypothetical protein B6I28_03560 [Fusobacteriia bacterium 4572_132]|nr:MAG: hypothetical protein B6I28_03560 [Fusobacteriia bacterium 4572_132]
MKNIKVVSILIFILLTSSIFGEMILPIGNGKLQLEFDARYYQIKNEKQIKNIQKLSLENIKIGAIIDNKIYSMREVNPKISYIEGTNILKIEGKIKEMTLVTYIYTPFDKEESFLNIYSKIITDNVKKKYDVKLYYEIDTNEKRKYVYWNNEKKYCFEQKLKIKDLTSNFNFYLATKKNMENFKLRKIYNRKEKMDNEKIYLISDLGKIDMYETKEDFVIVGNSEKIDEIESVNFRMIFEEEVLKWREWQENLEIEDLKKEERGLLLQNITLLKMNQLENGKIISTNEIDGFSLETMLYSIQAFINLNYFTEAKKGLEYILKNEENSKNLKNVILTDSLFLEVLSEYLERSKDFNYLKTNYIEIDSISQKLFLELNTLGEKFENIEEKSIASVVIKRFSKYLKSISFFAPTSLIQKYEKRIMQMADTIKVDKIKIENYGTTSSKINQIKYLRSNLLGNTDSEVNQFLLDYKSELGLKDTYMEYDINMLLEILITLYEKGLWDKADPLYKKLTSIIRKNRNILPAYVKSHNGVYQYGGENVDIILSAKYILMLTLRRKNEIEE